MKKNILIFLLVLSSAMSFAQRQGGAPQPLPTSTLYTKVKDIQQLHFSNFYTNPDYSYHKSNQPHMIIDDRGVNMTDFNSHSLADIDRIEYIEPDATQQAANSFVNMLYSGRGSNGVIFVYTKQFINGNPDKQKECDTPALMGYSNLVKRAYTKP